MALYKLTGGTVTRGEDGKKVHYARGSLIELTAEQASFLRGRIEPAAAPEPAPKPAPAPPPEVAPKAAEKPSPAPAPVTPEPDVEPEVTPPPEDWSTVLDGNVGQVGEAVEKMTDPDQLRSLAAAELKTDKPRTGVARAIEERIAALESGRE